jgi:hypothetical protein
MWQAAQPNWTEHVRSAEVTQISVGDGLSIGSLLVRQLSPSAFSQQPSSLLRFSIHTGNPMDGRQL